MGRKKSDAGKSADAALRERRRHERVSSQIIDLEPGAAVEIGILIGKFYAADIAPA